MPLNGNNIGTPPFSPLQANQVMPDFPAPPTNPAPGFTYYDTTLKFAQTFVGGVWVPLGQPTEQLERLPAAPTNAIPGMVYFDTTLGYAQIYGLDNVWHGILTQ